MSAEFIDTILSNVRNGRDGVKAHERARPQAARGEGPATPQAAEGGGGGRDGRGRFAKGNSGGPGNPFARQMARLRKALVEIVSEEDVKDIAASLLVKAKSGDIGAAKLLLSYVVGRPTAAPDPDRLELEEWQLWRAGPVDMKDVRRVMEGVTAELANNVVRAALPFIVDHQRQRVADGIRPSPEELARAERHEEHDDEDTAELEAPEAEPDTVPSVVRDRSPGRAANGAHGHGRPPVAARPAPAPAPMTNGSNGRVHRARPEDGGGPNNRFGRRRNDE